MPKFSPEQTQEAADIAACRALMRGGSRSFFAAGLLLPKTVHQPATALYAFCRLADDAIDESRGKQAALERLRLRLDRAYAGTPHNSPADRAFAATIARHNIPRALPESLLEGFAWDAENRRYADLRALQDYGARVAGTVGAMMTVLMGVRSPEALARACDLGIAMQLTNIARDVGEDARQGRLYLPLQWLHEEGVDPEAWLAAPAFTPAIGRVVRRLLWAADSLYTRSTPGIAHLPAACRPGIRAAGLIYRAIGHDLAANGYDSVRRRAHVPASRKILLLGRSLGALTLQPGTTGAPALPAARYLVEAAGNTCAHEARQGLLEHLDGRVNWVIDLFARLEQRELESA